ATSAATSTAGFLRIQALVGGSGADTLVGPNAARTWSLAGPGSGQVGAFTFTGVENLTGGPGVDVFRPANRAGVPGRLDGGGGGAGLDYSAYPTAVPVTLPLGTAPRVAGGVANVRNVFGGAAGNTLTGGTAGNILVGGVGVDTIAGGAGRSILIGGK